MARSAPGRGLPTQGVLNARRAGPGANRAGGGKSILHFDRSILLSERFRAGRPNGVDYKSPEPEFFAANARLAQFCVSDIVEALEAKIASNRRPQKETKNLLEALKAPENIDFNAQGFTVGIDTYLESTPAGKYFRNLEFGSSVFVGRVIEGFFSDGGGRRLKPEDGAKNALKLVQVGSFTNPGDTKAGRFKEAAPISVNPSRSARTEGTFAVNNTAADRRLLERGHRGPSHAIVIKNPIPSYFYFRDGVEAFKAKAVGPGKLIAQQYEIAAKTFVERGGLIIN